MNDRKLGKFRVTNELIHNNPQKVAEVFHLLNLVPVQIQFLWDRNEFEYIALSSQFDEVKEGSIVPDYDVIISEKEDGELSVSVKKI